MNILSDADRAEVDANPPGECVIRDAAHFQFRLAIAKRVQEVFLGMDDTLSAECRAIYEQYPLWAFYEDGQGGLPRRAFGVFVQESESGEKTQSLHMITAHIGWVNKVIGGVECSRVVRVEQWSERARWLISHCKESATFLDPLGYLAVISAHYANEDTVDDPSG